MSCWARNIGSRLQLLPLVGVWERCQVHMGITCPNKPWKVDYYVVYGLDCLALKRC
ncbi:hypothetical protein JB92DRAFT_2985505 [Gautieria morchelliformis]|nr:hypothetical protein JB92DRAFT_2985505 [Gautieria morchelliformis]